MTYVTHDGLVVLNKPEQYKNIYNTATKYITISQWLGDEGNSQQIYQHSLGTGIPALVTISISRQNAVVMFSGVIVWDGYICWEHCARENCRWGGLRQAVSPLNDNDRWSRVGTGHLRARHVISQHQRHTTLHYWDAWWLKVADVSDVVSPAADWI